MALFKSDPTKTAARELDAARANLSRLKTKLADIEAAIATHKAQAQTAAATGAEDSTLDLVESTIRAAQDRRETIVNAISTVETQLAALETAHREAADRVQREATASEIELLTRRCTESGAVLLKAAEAHAGFVERLVPIVPEAGSILRFALILSTELPAATELVARLARQHREAVLRGSAPAALAAPMEPYVAPAGAPREPTTQLFATRPVKWKTADGVQRVAQKFTDVQVTQSAASRGLAVGALVPMDHPARREHHNTVGGNADPALAFDLDAEPERLAAPILASPPQLIPFDRGPAKILQVQTTRL